MEKSLADIMSTLSEELGFLERVSQALTRVRQTIDESNGGGAVFEASPGQRPVMEWTNTSRHNTTDNFGSNSNGNLQRPAVASGRS